MNVCLTPRVVRSMSVGYSSSTMLESKHSINISRIRNRRNDYGNIYDPLRADYFLGAMQKVCGHYLIQSLHQPCQVAAIISQGKWGPETLGDRLGVTWRAVGTDLILNSHTFCNKKCFPMSHIFLLHNKEATAMGHCFCEPENSFPPALCPGQPRRPSPADGRCALVVITDRVVLFIYVFTIQLDIVS